MLKQIRHLVGYDVRALRPPLMIWGLILAVQAALLVAGPARLGIDMRLTGSVGYDYGVLMIRLALTAVLVALVVQRDALVGTTAFWRTRPIPRQGLLASKATTVLLLVVAAPWLVTFIVLLALGLPLPAAVRGAFAVAVEQAFVATLALGLAALTANLAHFVIGGFAGVTLVVIFLALLRAVAFRRGLVYVAAGWASGVFTAGVVAAAVAATVHQFLSLRTGRSATVIAGGLVLAAAGGGLWQPLDADRDARAVDSSVLAPGSVSVRLSEVRWQSRRPFRNGAIHPERVLTAILTPTGEPDAILLTVDSLDVSLSCGGRTVTGRSYRVPGGSVWSAGRAAQPSDQPYRSIRAALGDTELVLPRAVASQVLVGLGTLPEDEASRLTGLDCVLEGTVGFRAFRFVVTARTALAVDNSLTTTAQHSTITTIGPVVRVLPLVEAVPERPGVDITLRSTVVGPTPWIGRPLPPTGFFLLRNEARRQAVFLTPWGQSRFTPVLGLVSMNVSDVWTGSQRLEFDAIQSEAPFAFDEEWLRGAELLLVEPEFLGVVTRPLRVEGVPAPGGE